MLPRLVRNAARSLTLVAAWVAWPAALASQATTGALHGIIRDSLTGDPVAEARIAVRGTPLTAFTDSAGAYQIAGLPAGTYAVRIAAARSLTLDRDTIRILAGRTTRMDATLQRAPAVPRGSLVDGTPILRNRLPPGLEHQEHRLVQGQYTDRLPDSLAGDRGVLEGTVRDERHRPIPRARVSIVGTRMVATADSAGRFRFGAVPAGRYDVRAAQVGYRSVELTGVRIMSRQTVTQDFRLMQTATGPREAGDTR